MSAVGGPMWGARWPGVVTRLRVQGPPAKVVAGSVPRKWLVWWPRLSREALGPFSEALDVEWSVRYTRGRQVAVQRWGAAVVRIGMTVGEMRLGSGTGCSSKYAWACDSGFAYHSMYSGEADSCWVTSGGQLWWNGFGVISSRIGGGSFTSIRLWSACI
ncbi:hypothetical protein EJ06DRAFT_293110 [Trichodelitschia bisporula]|uniref:Uncharacterized protein n=1 Tax=Trichodelitschia bisporula TaxID=703511 RepID=A0A6G1I662_9PEZI|nr:hypothetical protein EJ06DRAFT_293110 [Trichodelitschia bisporula]